MEKLKSKAKPILAASISPHLYKRVKEECQGGNVSAFVERAIIRELEQKEKEQKDFQEKLIADYQSVAKNKKLQQEVAIWDETINDAWNTKYSRRAKKDD
jgi:hypothetical protein